MFCIGICQNQPDFLARIISAALTESGFPVFYCDGKSIRIPHDDAKSLTLVVSGEPYDSEIQFDLCVFEPNFQNRSELRNATRAIIPDSFRPEDLGPMENAITYGLCHKNTVTVSSLIGNDLVISVQREIPTLSGDPVDPQEFHIKLAPFGDVEDALAVVTTLLAFGVTPEKISKISKM